MELEALHQLFTELFSLEPPVDWGSVRYAETEGWDSLAQIRIVHELETRFEVRLPDDALLEEQSVGSLKRLVLASVNGT